MIEGTSRELEASFLQFKRDVVAAMVEFLGTLLFLLLGLGGIQAAAVSNTATQNTLPPNTPVNAVATVQQLLYISTSMGLALLAAAWTFFRVSGSVFNPNIAIALLLTGALKPMRFCLYVIAQITGAIAASALLSATLPGPLAVGASLGVGTKPWQGLLIEAFLTCALTLTVLLVAVEKHRATPFAPVAIGLVLFASHLLGVVFTGAAMNSARAFGPDVIIGFKSHHWIYWLGPSLGAVLATGIYVFLKSIDYYELTPKQDSDNVGDSPDLKGIEVRMRRRHQEHMGAAKAPKPVHTSINVPRTLSEAEMAGKTSGSGYPAYNQYGGSPFTNTESPAGRPSSPSAVPESPHPIAAGLAMAGGMGLAMGGDSGKEALMRPHSPPQHRHDPRDMVEEVDDPPNSPRTSRYI